MELDQVLVRLGECGPYQRRVYHLYSVLLMSVAIHNLAQVFLAGSSDHWCTVPLNNTQLDCTKFGYGACNDIEWSRPEDDADTNVNEAQCRIYFGAVQTNDSDITGCVDGYTFDHSRYTRTIQEDFKLVCDKKANVALAQSIYFAGLLTGSLVFGSIADWIGRKPTTILCMIIQCSFGLITSFVKSFAAYCVLRFIIAGASVGLSLVSYILVTELVGVKWRTIAGVFVQIYWAVGVMFLALLAYLIRDWRNLQIALSIPTAMCLLYMPFLPESVRWLLSQGAVAKAEAIIHKTAKVNKVTISEHPISEKCRKDNSGKKHTLLDLFRSPVLCKRTINIMYTWFVIAMIYYGLSLSTSDLGIDPYLSFMLSGLIEIPAYILSIPAIDRFGRRLALSAVMLLGGIACFSAIFINPGPILVTVVMVGKFGLTAAFGIVFIYSAELLPTPVRSAGMGIASMSGRVGCILSPLVLYMVELWKPLPMVIFSSLSFSGGMLCLLLPETMGKKLPETLREGETFGLQNKKNSESYSMVENTPVTEDLV